MITVEVSDKIVERRHNPADLAAPPRETKPVCFRLPLKICEALTKEASTLGETQGEFMRRILVTYVAGKIERKEQEAA